MVSYWAETPEDELSQGDLLADSWIGTTVSPRVGLARGATAKGGLLNWQEAPFSTGPDGLGHFLSRGKPAHCIVLSQSCEIDKKGGKAPVLIAPVIDLVAAVQDDAVREKIRSAGRYAFFPLPALGEVIRESYVDLRAITYVPRVVLDGLPRAASASTHGARALTAHLVGFFTRVDLEQLAPSAK